jgi:hypothetical protein
VFGEKYLPSVVGGAVLANDDLEVILVVEVVIEDRSKAPREFRDIVLLVVRRDGDGDQSSIVHQGNRRT